MSTSTTRTPKPQRETEAENSATVAQLNYDYESDKQLYLPSHWSSQNLGKFLALYPSPTAAAAACCRHNHTHTHNQQGGAGPVGKWIPGVPGRHQPVCQSSDIAQVLGGAGLSRLFSPSRDDRNIHGGAGLAFFHFFFPWGFPGKLLPVWWPPPPLVRYALMHTACVLPRTPWKRVGKLTHQQWPLFWILVIV